ncbi:hypothetical protein FGO68_gene665 [Halteria grandinella]|uniref:MORN repeat protein n=1 Tax=Halteria grandinella TaxID=5974 RepID=A0A8J8NQP1_HALGN|nr:hypothetical protein FGO68_gene665 [Halteria grandinella]
MHNDSIVIHVDDHNSLVTAAIKIQSWYRTYRAKREYVTRQSDSSRRKYFTLAEFWETISPVRVYAKQNIQVRSYSYQSTGAQYYGQWLGGFREGQGVMTWPDGARYEGGWHLNRAHGHGKFTHVVGDIYEGAWYRDKACGHGTYTSATTGGTYNGTWHNDFQHGSGLEHWQDGSSYHGDFAFGEKHGLGRQVWPDGSVFIGQWEGNSINGFGRQQWTDKRCYEGEFARNLMHGFGRFRFSDGKVYEGFYQNDKKHGYGIFKWTNSPTGRRYEGWWTEGRQDGLGILFEKASPQDSEIKVQYVIYKDGVKQRVLTNDEAHLIHQEYEQRLKKTAAFDTQSNDQILRMTFVKPVFFDQKCLQTSNAIRELELRFTPE